MRYSVIVPVFNEREALEELACRVERAFSAMGAAEDFELLLVDDGSSDGSRDAIRALAARRPHLRPVFLRKNVGKSRALRAGFLKARGRILVTLDGDLQDAPEDISRLLAKLEEGFDMVSGWRRRRSEGALRVLGSWLFNRAVSSLSGLRLHDFNCGLKAYRSHVVRTLHGYGEYHRFIPLLAHLAGFKVTEVAVRNDPRRYGVSKYPALRYQGFFDLLSILFTYKYGFSPLHFFGGLGVLLTFPSLAVISYLVGRHCLYLLGFGAQYMLLNRPLLTLAFTVCILGINIFLTGFVCDFILHHAAARDVGEPAEFLAEEAFEAAAKPAAERERSAV